MRGYWHQSSVADSLGEIDSAYLTIESDSQAGSRQASKLPLDTLDFAKAGALATNDRLPDPKC